MRFPSQYTVPLNPRYTVAAVEEERALIKDALELSEPQLAEAKKWGSTISFIFTNAEMNELQLRQGHIACPRAHVQHFLNTALEYSNLGYVISEVELARVEGGYQALCQVAMFVPAE